MKLNRVRSGVTKGIDRIKFPNSALPVSIMKNVFILYVPVNKKGYQLVSPFSLQRTVINGHEPKLSRHVAYGSSRPCLEFPVVQDLTF